MTMHDDEVRVGGEAVRALVRDQMPQWRDLPVRAVPSTGTVHALFRIGDGLVARLPLRLLAEDVARAWLEAEAAAATELADASPVPAPRPVAIGDPGAGYPMPWAVQTWLDGHDGWHEDPSASTGFAEDLATLLLALRAAPTRGRTFTGAGRGGHLPDHDDWVATCLDRSAGLVDVPRLRELWSELRTLPPSGADVMTHGDLMPGNVLVRDGRLTGLLDGGGFGAADPALDLVAAWHLLDAGPRALLRERLGDDDLVWDRGRAWALEQALGLGWYYRETNPPMSHIGVRTLERLLEDT